MQDVPEASRQGTIYSYSGKVCWYAKHVADCQASCLQIGAYLLEREPHPLVGPFKKAEARGLTMFGETDINPENCAFFHFLPRRRNGCHCGSRRNLPSFGKVPTPFAGTAAFTR